jgi:hypothetical protein
MLAPITKRYKSNTGPMVSEEWVIEKRGNKAHLNSHKWHSLTCRVGTVREYGNEKKD